MTIISYIVIIICNLISIALITLIESKVMASSQRRLGPNTTLIYGLAQPITDGSKLALKQLFFPYHTNSFLFFLSAIISFFISIIIWYFLPLSISLYPYQFNILFILALSSISIYGLLLYGWSTHCIYTILGSIRSSAQLISYELSVTILILTVLITHGFNFITLVDSQFKYWNIITFFPIFIAYFITIISETNRAPFDLSELVSGFNTEHNALPFAFFFIAEYGFVISQSFIIVFYFLNLTIFLSIYHIIYYHIFYLLNISLLFSLLLLFVLLYLDLDMIFYKILLGIYYYHSLYLFYIYKYSFYYSLYLYSYIFLFVDILHFTRTYFCLLFVLYLFINFIARNTCASWV